jgi:hypothetical protein
MFRKHLLPTLALLTIALVSTQLASAQLATGGKITQPANGLVITSVTAQGNTGGAGESMDFTVKWSTKGLPANAKVLGYKAKFTAFYAQESPVVKTQSFGSNATSGTFRVPDIQPNVLVQSFKVELTAEMLIGGKLQSVTAVKTGTPPR